MIDSGPKRFAVALSFPGEHRDFVEKLATHLSASLTQERVLYDKYFEAEFARPELDVYLPNLYRTQSKLVVIFLCPEYRQKHWCLLEWRYIRDLITTVDQDRIMFLSFGEPGDPGALAGIGILSGDGYLNIGDRPPEEIAKLIIKRLDQSEPLTIGQPEPLAIPIIYSNNITPPEEKFVGREAVRQKLSDWYRDESVQVGALIGMGGMGKSSTTRKWYDTLATEMLKPEGVFWWGFYNNADPDRFLGALLNFVTGDENADQTLKDSWDRVDHIKRHLPDRERLIVLDGFEEFQHQEEGELFGKTLAPQQAELLRGFVESSFKGLVLLTTRTPLTDLVPWQTQHYRVENLEELSETDACALMVKMGVDTDSEKLKGVIARYRGHALSLTLLSGILQEHYQGNLEQVEEIPDLATDQEAGGKAHRILRWYDQLLDEERRTFLRIFSLFRIPVAEREFKGVFRKSHEHDFNHILSKLSPFQFKTLVSDLHKRRLLSKNEKDEYTAHPLVRSYFTVGFPAEDQRFAHQAIYRFIGSYAPETTDTLEEMQPLFEQVYHGCAAGEHQAALDEVYYGKIQRKNIGYLIHTLGAWETDLTVLGNFFPEGNLTKIPLLDSVSGQTFVMNGCGFVLKGLGRSTEAESLLNRKTQMQIEAKDWGNVSMGYQNLADLQLNLGHLPLALKSAEAALQHANTANSKHSICTSKVYLAYIRFLMGLFEDAESIFIEADQLERSINPNVEGLYGNKGYQYAEFLKFTRQQEKALQVNQRNLEICERNNWPKSIALSQLSLGSLARLEQNHQKAETDLREAERLVRQMGRKDIEIPLQLEWSRLFWDLEQFPSAKEAAEAVIALCERTGYRLFEPEAKVMLGKIAWQQDQSQEARSFANDALQQATTMGYHGGIQEAKALLTLLEKETRPDRH